MTSSLAGWLRTLDVDGLARVLDHRPDVGRPPAPRSLGELAERLQRPGGASAALETLPLPATHLVELILATRPPTRAAVAEAARVPVEALDEPLRLLSDRALAWPDGDELRVCEPLTEGIRWPLNLGRTADHLLARARVEELSTLASHLGLPTSGKRADLRAALAGWYADAERVRALVATAPEAARALLTEVAWDGPEVEVPGLPYGGADRIAGPVGWAVRHGLLVVTSWHVAHQPREVALALRGPDWRPPLELAPPPVPLVAVEPEAVAREAAAAAGVALDQITAVLAECGRTPLALLKSGGVGVREVKRLARSVRAQVLEVGLWLEVGRAAGLLAVTEEGAAPTAEYDRWCAADPAQRLVTVLSAWWSLAAPTSWPGRQSPPPVLRPDRLGPVLTRVRRALLDLTCGYPQGSAVADPQTLAAALTWRLPFAVLALEPVDEHVAALWAEARLLGLVGHGAASEFGRALDRGDLAALGEAGQRVLAPPTGQAIFQADLTAVVAGTPAAALADLLDAAADRESRGAASTWRFTAGSVRRALDTGHDAQDLTRALAAVAAGGALPQALTYLVSDTARRHGLVRVRAVQCVLHAADKALLVEVAATRSLSSLGLSVLSPTVLGSAAPVQATLAALRAAGYAPVAEDAAGTPVLDRLPRSRAVPQATTRPTRPQPADHLGLAKALLAEPTTSSNVIPLRRIPAQAATETAHHLASYADHLGNAERRLLAEAIDREKPVRIAYVDSGGQLTDRVIEQAELDGDSIVAWCRLREDERRFLLRRVTAVLPA